MTIMTTTPLEFAVPSDDPGNNEDTLSAKRQNLTFKTKDGKSGAILDNKSGCFDFPSGVRTNQAIVENLSIQGLGSARELIESMASRRELEALRAEIKTDISTLRTELKDDTKKRVETLSSDIDRKLTEMSGRVAEIAAKVPELVIADRIDFKSHLPGAGELVAFAYQLPFYPEGGRYAIAFFFEEVECSAYPIAATLSLVMQCEVFGRPVPEKILRQEELIPLKYEAKNVTWIAVETFVPESTVSFVLRGNSKGGFNLKISGPFMIIRLPAIPSTPSPE